MRVVYLGTSEFAEEPLKGLLGSGYETVAVVTQPDRPKGRGRKMLPPPVKKLAERSCLRIEQPVDPNSDEFVSSLEELKPDVIVVAAYAHKLGSRLLEVPPGGCINIHPSLLPLLRGAAPLNWAIIKGEKKTGISIIKMNERFDAGEILKQKAVDIGDEETAGELSERLSRLGSELLLETLEAIEQGGIEGMRQDEDKATRAPRIKKDDCKVEWSRTAVDIKNLIRGLHPRPGAYSHFRGKIVKLARAKASSQGAKGEPGEIAATDDGIVVVAGEGVVSLLSLQPEGKREMSWIDFKNGFGPQVGDRFGE